MVFFVLHDMKREVHEVQQQQKPQQNRKLKRWATQDEEKQNKNTRQMCKAALYANKHFY